MIAEIGHFSLILALCLGAVQVLAVFKPDPGPWLMSVTRPVAITQFGFVLLAFIMLMTGFITSDFSIMNVAENSHTAKPLLYKIAGSWGSHEGSLLLWILILCLFSALVALFGVNLPPRFRARVLGMQGTIAFTFLLFTLMTSNPFLRLDPAPANGAGLNPLLQDPGLAFHPPMLYTGYVGFSIAYAFAMAALIEGRVDALWARWVRPWTLLAWVFLTFGIALGSWWAYYELGWGGWWFWDPVENASLLPWLAGTALLHSALVVEKRDGLKSWTILLAIITFSLSIMGTFLVRSGILTSVHTFAIDPGRGIFVLLIMALFTGGGFLLYGMRAHRLRGGGLFTPLSREGALVMNNLLLSTACAAVLIGTLYPLVLEALTGEKISVGAPFFNLTFGWIMLPLLALMPLAPFMSWKRADLKGVVQRVSVVFGLSVLAVIIIYAFKTGTPLYAPIGIGLGLWLVLGTLWELGYRTRLFRARPAESLRRARNLPRASWGMTLAHFGFGVLVIGTVAMTAWKQESVVALKPGDSFSHGPYTLTLETVRPVTGPNYNEARAEIILSRDGQFIARMAPARRVYTVRAMTTTEAAIFPEWNGDLFIALGEQQADGSWIIRFWRNPFISFIWLGAVIMGLGGLISLSDRRLRIGIPKRASKIKRPIP